MKDQTKSYLYAFFAVILWGSVPAITKLTLKNLDFFQVTTYSLFFSALVMLVIVYLQKKISLFKKYTPKDYFHMILLGSFGIFVTYVLYFGGINYAPAADAQILNNMWQIFAIIGAFFFLKEQITTTKIIALLLGFAGAYIVITKFSFQGLNPVYAWGYALAVGSAFTEGLFTILGKKYHYETWTSMVVYFISSFVLILITTWLFSRLVVPSLMDLMGVAYLGIFGIALPFTFMFRAMKLGDTAKATSIGFLSPFLALVFISFILGDTIVLPQIVGLLFIVGGILIQNK
ncbi:DMT family transporter [Candidatus Woesearchaeota archaeon]|nr:DMT family transporter [Candidatus Woesearchaeota archaeon]